MKVTIGGPTGQKASICLDDGTDITEEFYCTDIRVNVSTGQAKVIFECELVGPNWPGIEIENLISNE